MLYVGVDSETYLITERTPTPRLVCASFAFRKTSSKEIQKSLCNAKEFENDLISLLKDDKVTMVLHNASFDMCVFALAYGQEVPYLIQQKYKKHLVICTYLNEKYHRIGTDGETPMGEFSLKWLSQKYLGITVDKGEDTWRLRYSELDGMEIKDYPELARTYAMDDAELCLRVFEAQGLANEVDVFNQFHTDWLSKMMTGFGMSVDQEYLETLYAPLEELIASKEYELRKYKIKKIKAGQRTKYLEFLSGYWQPEGKLKGTIDVKLNLYLEKLKNLGMDVTALSMQSGLEFGKDTKVIKEVISAVSIGLGIEPKRTESGGISTDNDSLESIKGNHLGIDALLELGGAEKVISTYLNNWRGRDKIHAQIDVALKTGRYSVSKPSLQNIPTKGRIRGCFVPENPDTHYFCSIDYGQIELCTLAQIMIWQGFGTVMADAINANMDLHCLTGANILGITYESMIRRVESGEPEAKQARKLAKVTNFGGFGGMGKKTFAEQAKKQGIDMDEGKAYECLEALKRTFPAQEYFNRRQQEIISTPLGEYYKCEQLPTDRIRMIKASDGYCTANNSPFQGLASDIIKLAHREIKDRCWFDVDPLFANVNPLMPVHDEWLLEIPKATAHESAFAVANLMIECAKKLMPDIKNIKAEPALMLRWEKEAESVYDENGKLIAWEYEKFLNGEYK